MDETDNKPVKPRNRGADTVDADRRRVAVMVGAGMTSKAIAKKIGRTRRGVDLIRKKVEADEELRQIRDQARARVAPKAIAILEKNLDTMDRALDGVEVVVGKRADGTAITAKLPPPLSHQASALRELAAVAGLTRDDAQSGGQGGSTGLQIPMTPEAVAALIKAVKENEAQRQQPREVQGERIE